MFNPFMTTYRSLNDPYFGISTSVFPQKTLKVLMSPINEQDVEIKPDGRYVAVQYGLLPQIVYPQFSTLCDTLSLFVAGLIYLPEIKYRRILNQAFGPGGWALMPRGETLHYQVLIDRSVVWLYRSVYSYLLLVKGFLQCLIPTERGRGSPAHHKRVFSLLSRPIYIPGYW